MACPGPGVQAGAQVSDDESLGRVWGGGDLGALPCRALPVASRLSSVVRRRVFFFAIRVGITEAGVRSLPCVVPHRRCP